MLITVTIKTVKQQTARIDIDETATVLDLKGKILEKLGPEFPSEHQKLIFRGKILQDTGIIGELGLTQAGFVVVMVSKPKSAPVVPPPVEAPQPAPGPSTSQAPPEAEGASGATQSTEQMVDNLMEMTGNSLPRDHVQEVLLRSQNNPVVAGAILAGGMDELVQPAPLPPGGSLPPVPQGGVPATDLAQATENPLNFLRTQPQFQQLRTLLQSNPNALPQILHQIQQTNPELYQLINSNRTAFMELMNDPSTGPSGTGGTSGVGVVPPGGTGGSAPGVISVTPTEMEAINRLKALGFPEHMVVQAYFACEKNEEMAANFLLSENQQD